MATLVHEDTTMFDGHAMIGGVVSTVQVMLCEQVLLLPQLSTAV